MPTSPGPTSPIRFGVDRLVAEPSLLGRVHRVGLVTNDAARTALHAAVRSSTALMQAGVPLTRLFGPEHGLSANAADGNAVADGVDPLTGLPVVSLYGTRLGPTPASVSDLDAMLFDIPDVGARFYTYLWTMHHVQSACAIAGVPLFVLDRPNPLGGVLDEAEGPMLDPACHSFLGAHKIPVRHQLTLGEMARLFQREAMPEGDVRVLQCEGWNRAMRWPDTALPWVPPSPAMMAFESAQLYPGMCLFEATNLSVGRGTSAAFQRIGAPWLDAAAVLRAIDALPLAGVRCEGVTFTPELEPHAGERCSGVHLNVLDTRLVRPVAAALRLLTVVRRAHPDAFAWSKYPTAANPSGDGHFLRLLGRDSAQAWMDQSPEQVDEPVLREWTDVSDWSSRVRPALIYADSAAIAR